VKAVLSLVTCTSLHSLEMQRICERTCEVRLSASVGQEPDVGSAYLRGHKLIVTLPLPSEGSC
jgi:hypothetical protein